MTGGAAAVAAGLLLTGGLLALVLGVRRTEPRAAARPTQSTAELWARLTRRPPGVRGRRRDLILLGSLVAGFVLAALTGWVIALGLAPLLALGLPYLLVVPKPRDVELMEALDRWVRSLAATLATGKSVTDAIRVSRRTAPPLIADEIGTLVLRLNNRWDTDDALRRFADELDSADADGVVAALMLAARRGANGASLTLQALADSLQAQLRSRRVIEVERSKPYVVVRQVTVISLVTLAGVYLLAPSFFAPYQTPLGQVILAVLLVLYLASLILMRRKAQQAPRARILIGAGR
ncbi:MAG TPA: type II secretion system F family protein [Propionibacteriaceae bacterium]|nr:type II secretion system F family protein [Propionibacteriaceae bacterium]